MAKNYILWRTFPLRKVLVYLQPLVCNPSELDEITVWLWLVRAITPFKIIQDH